MSFAPAGFALADGRRSAKNPKTADMIPQTLAKASNGVEGVEKGAAAT
jgi:hypothetical protein